ncbi:MAG: polysaccharide deacetylase family protein [Myxococcaceae bacterium]
MKVHWDNVVGRAGRFAPSFVLRPLLKAVVGRRAIALCLHRVSEERRPSDFQPELTIDPLELDRLIGLLLSAGREAAGWLTVTFDDGYEDAARYVKTRAARFPGVEFLVFVCPEKSERRAGFRWDLVETRALAGAPLAVAKEAFDLPLDVEGENGRDELLALGGTAAFRLADLGLLNELRALPNVALGNHTNCHFKQTELTPAQSALEYQRSRADFERLFGLQRQFAFPFGTPRHEFDGGHVAQLRAQGPFLIWTTEPRPYRPSERRPGAVLPRFPVRGHWGHRGIAAWIAARALISRLRGPGVTSS